MRVVWQEGGEVFGGWVDRVAMNTIERVVKVQSSSCWGQGLAFRLKQSVQMNLDLHIGLDRVAVGRQMQHSKGDEPGDNIAHQPQLCDIVHRTGACSTHRHRERIKCTPADWMTF